MKIIASVLAVCIMMCSLCACGGSAPASSAAPAAPAAPASSAAPAPASSEAAPASSEAAPVDDGAPKTSADSPVYYSADLPKIEGPVLVTSAGQTADTNAVGTILERSGVEYTLNVSATKDEVAAAKTIFVAVGASMKGLGAAGVSVEQELARAKEALAAASDDAIIICCHTGGEARRGDTSDPFIDLVVPMSDALIAVEAGNNDGKLTTLANEAGIPYALFFALRDGMTVVKSMIA